MAQKNPTPGNDTGLSEYSDSDTKTRLAQLAEWLNLDPAPISYEDGSILLDDALLTWCNAAGVSLDWVFCGCPKVMAIAYQREFERERPFREMLKGFDKTEQGFLLEALQADRAGTTSLEDALATFTGKVETYRASL